MSLVRYEPSSIVSFLDDFWNGFKLDRSVSMSPDVDVAEDESGYRITADLPGLEKNDIKIAIENDVLTISGEKKQEKEEKKKHYHHVERSYGSFTRSFNLPSNIDASTITARYANGVLEVGLKKSEESKPKAIEVKVE